MLKLENERQFSYGKQHNTVETIVTVILVNLSETISYRKLVESVDNSQSQLVIQSLFHSTPCPTIRSCTFDRLDFGLCEEHGLQRRKNCKKIDFFIQKFNSIMI